MSDQQRAFILSCAWGGLFGAMATVPIFVAFCMWRGYEDSAAYVGSLAVALYVEVLALLRAGRIEYPVIGGDDDAA